MKKDISLREHLSGIAKKGGEATKKRLVNDPDYYKRIRSLRKKKVQ